MKECAKDIIDAPGGDEFLEELKLAHDDNERIRLLDERLTRLNISKASLADYDRDRQSRFLYLFHALGIDLGLCDYYRIFYSRRNKKMHQIC